MGYIKCKDFKTVGQSGLWPQYSIPPALREASADVAGPLPRTKGPARAVFIDFSWTCDAAESKNLLEQAGKSRSLCTCM